MAEPPGGKVEEKNSEVKFRLNPPRIIPLPELKDFKEVDVRYPLIPPYAFAHIYWDEEKKELRYDVEEFPLDKVEEELLKLIMTGIEEVLDVSASKLRSTETMIEYLEKSVRAILAELGAKISEKSYIKIMYYVYRDSIGLNQIEPLMNDYYIEDIECNGVGYPVYVVHRKYENIRTNVIFKSNSELMNFVEKLAQKCDKYVSYARPLLDGALPDGSRVNATYSRDITARGPTFTIRKFTKAPLTPLDLMRNKTACAEAFAFLSMLVQHKFNIMVIGETASGKTTFLNAILDFIPKDARICSIEDTRELNLLHSNWIPAVSRVGMRGAGSENYGEITMFELLSETFRQNPDYVIVGEVRGAEAYVLFQGMASGHPSYSTFHAGSVEGLVKRLQTPPINLPATLIEALDAVCIVTHIKEPDKNFRRLIGIKEIKSVKEQAGIVDANDVLVWNAVDDSFNFQEQSFVFEKMSRRTGIPIEKLRAELRQRTALLKKMLELPNIGIKEFNKIINEYYLNPKEVLRRLNVK
ncbi:MAG: type II/IV secretion system ATPase subunit [Candidatus Woesearchaeota archaeon]